MGGKKLPPFFFVDIHMYTCYNKYEKVGYGQGFL